MSLLASLIAATRPDVCGEDYWLCEGEVHLVYRKVR